MNRNPATIGAAYLEHYVPAVVTPTQQVSAWVRVRNEGATTWLANGHDPHPVDLGAWVNGSLAGAGRLPAAEVRPGDTAKISFTFGAPCDPGPFRLKLDLVKQGITFFEQQGIDPLLFDLTAAAAGTNAGPAKATARYNVRYVTFRAPEHVQPGVQFGVWVRVENRGAMTWESDPGHRRLVSVAVFLDRQLAAASVLPRPVRPWEALDVHVKVPAPLMPGRHEAVLDLVHEGITFSSKQGTCPLRFSFEVGPVEVSASTRLLETAMRRNSWFYHPSGGIASGRDGKHFPLFVERAQGCYVWDPEGNRFIDHTMGWGCALLGHAYEPVQAAIRRELVSGAILPLPHRLEMEVSEMLCEDIPCAEMVAFGKNGSDVCTLAVRLARNWTGRRVVLTCGYHGWQDWYVERLGAAGTGVPERNEKLVHPFPFNDVKAFRELVATYAHDLAAVILEPAGPAGGHPQGTGEDVDLAFLQCLAEEVRRAGALLIFDEIITGFRYRDGSVQRATGVVPDLACFGKALGAGMPISAAVGRAEIFRGSMANCFYGPTFKGETYSFAAAKAALHAYRVEPVAQHVWDFGERLKREINAICLGLGVHASMIGPPFRTGLAFHESDRERLALLRTLYLQELLKHGLITYHGLMLPSYAHHEDAMQQTLDGVAAALDCVKRADAAGKLHEMIEMPLEKL
jgi:glutamate-1-semialdehyde 2,1-aminomutase